MSNPNIKKFLIFRNYKYYYHKNGKMKGMSLKLTNFILEKLLLFKKIDRVLLRLVKIAAKKLRLNGQGVKNSKLGNLYKDLDYRSNYKKQPRKYIPNELSIEEFFEELNKRGVDYVILRWFEKLPEWPEEEDIDILIKDEHLDKIMDLFNNQRKGIPIDTYTLNGTKGCSFGIAGSYYPPALGKEILKNKILFKGVFYVPNTDIHFLSLIYHIVYHKAEKSGLPISRDIDKVYDEEDHNYKEIIKKFPQSSQLEKEINLTSLHEFLVKKDFTPNLDTLRKLYIMRKSQFLYSIAKADSAEGIEPYDVIVFFVRDWAFENNEVINIIDTIIDNNLDIISYYYLEGATQQKVTREVRGGNWSKGPYPIAGGEPRLVIVAFDYNPQKIKPDINSSHAFVSNANVFIKGKVRDKINNQMLATKWVNSLHSSDDFKEAKDYINIINSELYDKIKGRIDKRIKLYNTSQEVIKRLPNKNRRSKTEIIQYNNAYAIKKTYKKGRERYFKREVFAYTELSKKISTIPELLAIGENYYIMPYYENVLKNCNEREKANIFKKNKTEIIDFLKAIYNEGYALIDFNLGNVLITPENEVKIIDYEFLYEYTQKPNSFMESYDIKGIPKDFEGDMPYGTIPPGITYRNTWKKYLGELNEK